MGFSPSDKHQTTASLFSSIVDAQTGSFVGDLAVGGDLEGLIESPLAVILSPEDRSYPIEQYAQYEYDIKEARFQTSAGSLVATVTINGTEVEGLDNVTVSGARENATATSANSVSVGDQVTLVVSGTSSAADLEFGLKLERT
jgi:hypothetical protein